MTTNVGSIINNYNNTDLMKPIEKQTEMLPAQKAALLLYLATHVQQLVSQIDNQIKSGESSPNNQISLLTSFLEQLRNMVDALNKK